MITTKQSPISKFMEMVEKKNPAQAEFHQAVYEVALAILPFLEKHPEYKKANIL